MLLLKTLIVILLYQSSKSEAHEWSLEPLTSIARPRISAFNDEVVVASIILDYPKDSHTIPRSFKIKIKSFASDGQKKHTCEVPVKTLNKFGLVVFLQLTSLTEDVVILTWIDNDPWSDYTDPFLLLRIVDLKGCTYDDSKIDIRSEDGFFLGNDKFASIVTYRNSGEFELFFPNDRLCPGGGCRIGMNYQGGLTRPLTSVNLANISAFWNLIPVLPDLESKDLFLYQKRYRDLEIAVVNENGEITNSRIFPTTVSTMNNRVFAITESSAQSGLIGFCYLEAKTKIRCLQVDGKLKKRLDTSLQFSHDIEYIRVHNLDSGGFLLMSLRKMDYKSGHHGIYVTKISNSGQYNKSVEVTNIDCDIQSVDFFVKTEDKFCVTYTCIRPKKDSVILKDYLVYIKHVSI